MSSSTAPKSGEFNEGRLWFSRKSTLLTLGLTDSGIEELGDPREIEFPAEGDDFDKGDAVLSLDGSANRVELITPAAGFVKEINQTLKENPDLLTEDPTGEGWLVRMEIQDAQDIKEFIDEE